MQDERDPAAGHPAAHSMDTQWFALDSAGNVGVFDSGAGGAVPLAFVDAVGGCYYGPFIEDLLKLPSGVNYACDDLFFEPDGKVSERPQIGTDPSTAGADFEEWPQCSADALRKRDHVSLVLLWLRGRSAVARLGEGVLRLPVQGMHVVWCPSPAPAALADLMEAGEIMRGFIGMPLREERFGIFRYDCEEGAHAQPYRLRGTPSDPIRLDGLPDHLRPIAELVRFGETRFRKDARVQPASEFPCHFWEEKRWVDLEGKEHRELDG